MSTTITNPVVTGNQSTFQYVRKIMFLGNNTFEAHAYKSTAGIKTLVKGQVMGRVSATGFLLELKSAATDGSQVPYGILTEDITIQASGVPNLSVAVSGDVDLSSIVFDGADTVATVVDSQRLDDRLAGGTLGIKLIASIENTIPDND